MVLEQGGVIIVPAPLWQGASVFAVSYPKVRPDLVDFND